MIIRGNTIEVAYNKILTCAFSTCMYDDIP